MDQRIVECACLAIGVWLSREHVFAQLTPAQQQQVAAWLAQVDGKGTYPDNWVMFPAMSQAVRLRLGFPAPEADLPAPGAHGPFIAATVCGRPRDESTSTTPGVWRHYLFWAWMAATATPTQRPDPRRARSFLADFPYFGANGSCVLGPVARPASARFCPGAGPLGIAPPIRDAAPPPAATALLP
jgi:hypothetical protein